MRISYNFIRAQVRIATADHEAAREYHCHSDGRRDAAACHDDLFDNARTNRSTHSPARPTRAGRPISVTFRTTARTRATEKHDVDGTSRPTDRPTSPFFRRSPLRRGLVHDDKPHKTYTIRTITTGRKSSGARVSLHRFPVANARRVSLTASAERVPCERRRDVVVFSPRDYIT